MLMDPAEMGKTDIETPVTGEVKALTPGVELKSPASMLLQRRGRSSLWAGWWASPWLAARTVLCLLVITFVIMFKFDVNLQGKLGDGQKKTDDLHGEGCRGVRKKCIG